MHKKLSAGVFTLVAAVWPVTVLHAGVIVLNFTPSTLSASPGGMVEFTGTLTNTGATTVYLNGDVSILPYTHLTLDDSPFFNFAPLFLAGGGVYTGPFFDVMVDALASPGTYTGSFTVQGGADANAFDNLATQSFNVKVVSGSPVPEPRGFIPMAMGLALIVAWRTKRPFGPHGEDETFSREIGT